MTASTLPIPTRVKLLESQQADDHATLEEHNEWINGNGKPGAKQELALLDQRLDGIQTALNIVLGLMLTFIGAGAGITIWFITSVLPDFYRHFIP